MMPCNVLHLFYFTSKLFSLGLLRDKQRDSVGEFDNVQIQLTFLSLNWTFYALIEYILHSLFMYCN